jgi:hypothetical protein
VVARRPAGRRADLAPASPRLGTAPERSGTPGAFRFTTAERAAIFEHAAHQAGAAAQHIRRAAQGDPAQAADAAWAAADILHVAAKATRSRDLRRAADNYDRTARARYGRVPRATSAGHHLRGAARLIAMTGQVTSDSTLITVALAANLAALAVAVAELRGIQQHAAQAAAARAAAARLHAASSPARARAGQESRSHARSAAAARGDLVAATPLADSSQPGHPVDRRGPGTRAAPYRQSGPGPPKP